MGYGRNATDPTGAEEAAATSAEGTGAAGPKGLLADSRTVAVWTLVSRLTGFGRVATMGAVLGPTYFGNIFQTTAVFPMMLFALLGGSLIGAVLVPPLVRWGDGGNDAMFRRLANGFLGAILPILLVVGAGVVLLTPYLLTLLTAAVDDPAIREQQHHVGRLLMLMLMPQLLLYGVAYVGIAVQHARGRFALPAAAQVLENIGSIAVLGLSALIFGAGADLGDVPIGQVVLLGVGTTCAVGLHAATQWWGAFRAGVALLPSAGWRHKEVRRLLVTAFTSSGYTALYNFVLFAILIVARSLPGGVIAFQIGQNFAFVAVALGAVPLSAAQLPRLSRCFNEDDAAGFRSTFQEGFAFSRFLTIPAGFVLVALSGVLARAVAFGEMATAEGVAMIAACVASVGLGVFGEGATVLLTSAAYARRDSLTPLRAMMLRAVVVLAGTGLALTVMDGVAVLWTTGLALSAGNLAAAAYQYRGLNRALPAVGGQRAGFLWDLFSAAGATAISGAVIFWLVGHPDTYAAAFAAAFAGGLLAGGLYLGTQWARGSEEMAALLSLIGFGPGSHPSAASGAGAAPAGREQSRPMRL